MPSAAAAARAHLGAAAATRAAACIAAIALTATALLIRHDIACIRAPAAAAARTRTAAAAAASCQVLPVAAAAKSHDEVEYAVSSRHHHVEHKAARCTAAPARQHTALQLIGMYRISQQAPSCLLQVTHVDMSCTPALLAAGHVLLTVYAVSPAW
jgi:hypothetical protein